MQAKPSTKQLPATAKHIGIVGAGQLGRMMALAGYPLVIDWPVQWGDQDAFGHVNNTIYFRWFETVRIEYFERIGFNALLTSERIDAVFTPSRRV